MERIGSWVLKYNEAGEPYYERYDGRIASPYDVIREHAIQNMSAKTLENDDLTWEEKVLISMERIQHERN